ncbi:SRPBCC domain-containing protein [Pseudopedobacter saltans]|nr:SRPBCC domain-containing protein [Pseudopedobacter saltans]
MKLVEISAKINAPIEKVWKFWNDTEHVKKWNKASPNWHTPHAENDLRENGGFNIIMEAKDKSFSFDFSGRYTKVICQKEIAFTLGDQRKVDIIFNDKGDHIEIIETFEAEQENPIEMQQKGWQSILNNFKKYVESH